MRTTETLKRILWQIAAGAISVIAGVLYVVTDTKGYLGVVGTVVLFAMAGGALAMMDGIVDVIGEFRCDPDFRKRWWCIDDEEP